MKHSWLIPVLSLLIAYKAEAQEKEKKPRKTYSISISNKGLAVNDDKKEKKEEKDFEMDYFQIDLGFNMLRDNTDYTSAAAQKFVQISPSALGGNAPDKSVFDLRTGKSINVNLWPVMTKIRLVNGGGQKIYMYSGVGLQIYNFRFLKDISYRNDPVPRVVMDTIDFSKNKLGVSYLSVPLGFTFKTKLADKAWLVYGFGVTGGYRISTWTKQKSDERGKDKDHDKYNFNDFNGCLTGEFGIDGYFRLYASYQVTPLHENALDQHPLSIGFRFGGI